MKHPGDGNAVLSAAVTFALTLAGFTLGGYWLDGRMRTLPWCTVLGTVLGAGLGGFWFWQQIGKRPGADDAPR